MTADADLTHAPVTHRFVARQPIFDRDRNVFGYELLFRSSERNAFDGTDGGLSTQVVINNIVNVIGLPRVVGTARPFINFTETGLLNGDYQLMPTDCVVEVLETVRPTPVVVDACRRAKELGYTVALDDFTNQPGYGPLIEVADLIKVDFLLQPTRRHRSACARRARPGTRLLAEKVESEQDMRMACELGYHYAQGFFFCKPQIVKGRDVAGDQRRYLLFLAEVNRPDVNFNRLEQLVKGEPSLSVKLLRYLNTPTFGFNHRIHSVKQALVLLGEAHLRQWASVAAVTCLAEGKITELMRATLVRARFCELCGCEAGPGSDDPFELFLTGMLSLLDAVLDCPMESLLDELPVTDTVKNALLGAPTSTGNTLALACAGERGDFAAITRLCESLSLPADRVSRLYLDALAWAHTVCEPN